MTGRFEVVLPAASDVLASASGVLAAASDVGGGGQLRGIDAVSRVIAGLPEMCSSELCWACVVPPTTANAAITPTIRAGNRDANGGELTVKNIVVKEVAGASRKAW